MKKTTFLTAFLLLAGCSAIQSSFFVPLRIEKYCSQFLESPSGSYRSGNTCVQQELRAKDRLSGMSIPPRAEKYCRNLSESTGGSYGVMLACVEREMQTN